MGAGALDRSGLAWAGDGGGCASWGSGNVAIHAMEKAMKLGAKIIACSDSSGYVVDEDGIGLDLVREIKEVRRARIGDYVKARKDATLIATGKGTIWDVPCNIALPCATQNELTARDARVLISNSVQVVAAGHSIRPATVWASSCVTSTTPAPKRPRNVARRATMFWARTSAALSVWPRRCAHRA